MTATQLELALEPLVVPAYEPEATIQERYEAWRDANAWVLPYLADLLDEWSEHGGRRVGVKAATEWLRRDYQRIVRDGAGFAVNNSYTSRLARDLISRYPHLAAVIEVRELRAA